MSWRKQGTGIGIAAVLTASFVLSGGPPATAIAAESGPPPLSGIEDLASSTFAEVFPAGNASRLDPVEVFGTEVVNRVAPDATYEQIAGGYALEELFDEAAIRDLERRLSPVADRGSRHTRAVWFCGGVFECGFKFTNAESRVIANAALGGSGAAGQVICGLIPNPIVGAACRVVGGAVTAGAITVANIVLSNSSRCMLYRPNLAAVGLPWAVVTC